MEFKIPNRKLRCKGGRIRKKVLDVAFSWLPPSEKLKKTVKVMVENRVQPSYQGEEITKTEIGMPTIGSQLTEKSDIPNRTQPKVPTFNY